jgi:hypothetical protein
VGEAQDVERDLLVLESELRKLEAEYNMYFARRLPRPPWETRTRVQQMVKRLDRTHIQNYGHRFRFSTLQARFSAFVDLWDRGLRAREEGRPSPFAHTERDEHKTTPSETADRVVFVTAFRNPMDEMDKLHDLYDTLRDARQELGEENIPFHKFTELVKTQVARMKKDGASEVAFRVAVKDGKLNFTARGLKDGRDGL